MPAGFRGDAEILSYLLSHGESSDAHLQNLSRMSDDDMLHYFLQQNGARERLPPDASIESIRHFLQLFRANFDALLAYRPRPLPIDGLLFEASEPDGINPVGLTEVWQPYFRRLMSFTMPGNHITMNLPPNVASIIEQLRIVLRGA
jgi:thioesterase domain-containing protein